MKKYPISRCKNGKWIFVKEIKTSYEDALKEASRLQTNNKTGWQYRIWDNR